MGTNTSHQTPTLLPQETLQDYIYISQLPVVGSEHMRTLFDSLSSQQSESKVQTHKHGNVQINIKTHLDNNLFLSSL